jgi:hypothetical protein
MRKISLGLFRYSRFVSIAIMILFSISADLGAVKLCQLYSGSIRSIYPVGAIYISTAGTNPADLFGFGTWERFGHGRALVGVSESEDEFYAVGQTGGEKYHTLTVSEIPSHNHYFERPRWVISEPTDGDTYYYSTDSMAKAIGASTGYTGGGGAHNNLQPYVTVYIWRRTQ